MGPPPGPARRSLPLLINGKGALLTERPSPGSMKDRSAPKLNPGAIAPTGKGWSEQLAQRNMVHYSPCYDVCDHHPCCDLPALPRGIAVGAEKIDFGGGL